MKTVYQDTQIKIYHRIMVIIMMTMIIHLISVIKCLVMYMLGSILGVRSASRKSPSSYDIYYFAKAKNNVG